MALGDASSPVRFGKGASSPVDNRELFLSVFGGEVLTAFDSATVTLDKHFIKNLSGGAKSYRFPKTWKASAEYHTPGSELLGNDLSTSEQVITVDDILVSHYAISDIDRILSHFDMRSIVSNEMGRALAKVFDQNVFRQLILASVPQQLRPSPVVVLLRTPTWLTTQRRLVSLGSMLSAKRTLRCLTLMFQRICPGTALFL